MGDLSHFKDREPQIAAFDHFWDQNNAWIIAYTGISGLGKTSLLEWLAESRCKPRKVHMVQESLGQKSEDLGSLFLRIIEKLEDQKIIDRQAAKEFRAKRNEIYTRLQGERLSLQLTQTVTHGEDIKQSQIVNLRELMRSYEKLADEQQAGYFIDALRGNRKTELVVLLLDNYDAFQLQNDPNTIDLFWITLEQARRWLQGLHVVLASRERLVSQNTIQAFQNGLFTGYEDKLQQLKEKDSDEMLISLGVMNAEFRQAVYHNLAMGHPLVTRLAAEAYLKTPDGIQIKDIPKIFDQDQAIQWLQDRVLAGLNDEDRDLVDCGLMCREFNIDTLSALTDKTFSEVEKRFRGIQDLSFIQYSPNGWKCHPMIRQIYLSDRRRSGSESFYNFHKKAAAYFKSVGNIQESIYHLFFGDPKEAFQAWSTEINRASAQYNHYLWLELIILGSSQEFTLPPVYQAEIFFQDGQRNYYLYKLDSARECYERALIIFRDLGYRAGEANCTQALGDVYNKLPDPSKARKCYEQAMPIYCDIGDRMGEANCIQGLGDLITQFGEPPEARKHYEKALTIYRAIGARRGEANCIHALGDVHNDLSELGQARRCYQEALTIYRDIGDRRGEANCIYAMGEVHFRLLELPEARRLYEEALPIFRAVSDSAGEANCIQGLGDVHLKLSELSEARKRFENALTIFRAIGSPRGSAKCIQALGDVYTKLSEWPQARECYEEALAIHRSIGASRGEANCICALGDAHYYLSELPEARRCYEEALPIYRLKGDRAGEAHCIRSLGGIYNQLSEPFKARRYFEEALTIYQAIGALLGEANCDQGLGDVHAQLSELPEAGERYKEALTIYRAVGVPRETANCIRSLGDIYNQLSDLSQARKLYEEALIIFRAINDRQSEANCIQSLGDVLAVEENWEAAEASYHQALRIYQVLGLRNSQANTFKSLGNLYDYQKRYPHAVDAYTKALNLFPADPAYCQNRASIYLKMREIPLAEADILDAQKIQPDHPYLFLRLGELAILRGSYPEARNHFNVALRKLPRLKIAWFGIGESFLLEGDTVHAVEAYRKGLDITGRLEEITSEINKLYQLCEEHPGQAEIIQNVIELLTDWKSKE